MPKEPGTNPWWTGSGPTETVNNTQFVHNVGYSPYLQPSDVAKPWRTVPTAVLPYTVPVEYRLTLLTGLVPLGLQG